MADARRVQRVSKQIQRYVASIIDEELALPTLVSVLGVRCDSSFTKAQVNVSVYGEASDVASTMDELESNAWLVRRELSRRTKMKRTPEIIFVNDTSAKDGQDMIDLLDSLSGADSPQLS